MTKPEERRPYYDRIEAYLEARELDYELHFQPGHEDVGELEEYRLTNTPTPAILCPAILPPTPESISLIRRNTLAALKTHAGQYDRLEYRIVLCGEGWTDGQAQALQESIPPPPGVTVLVQTLAQVTPPDEEA